MSIAFQAVPDTVHRSTVARFGGPFEPLSLAVPPQPLTSFVGRERELAAAAALLRERAVRLLTVTGPGGVGKTRLAMRLAGDLAPDFADGVAFVPLATVSDPGLVVDAIAQVLGTRDTGGAAPLDRLRFALGGKGVLLVLDNFEQVAAAAPEVAQLLAVCPGLKLLVTSRVPLHVVGEQEYPLAPLAVTPEHENPSRHSEAVALFEQRARAVRPGFALRDDNAADVAAICARLDGLPLAIELAAARSKVLSPSALLARLSDPLAVLKDGPRDQPTRLQTMRNAIAWSYELLTPEEQTLFRRLSVFAGGFSLAAAEAVAAGPVGPPGPPAEVPACVPSSVLDGLTSLVDKSLVWGADGPDGEPRFGMLETVREFAAERLEGGDDAREVRRRHAAWCLALAVDAEPPTMGPLDGAKLDVVEAELANLRAALAWLDATGETAAAVRLAAALGSFWHLRGRLTEGRERLERALARGGDLPADVRAKALFFAGWLAIFTADNPHAVARLTESQALFRDLADREGVVATMIALGGAAEYRGAEDEAWVRYGEALAQARDLGNARLIAWALVNVADAAYRRGEIDQAADLAGEALAVAESAGDRVLRSPALGLAAQAELERGDPARAARLCHECLAVSQALGFRSGVAFGLVGLAGVAAAEGLPERAARLLGAADAVLRALGMPVSFNHEQQRRTRAAARSALGEAAFAAAWDAGRTMAPDAVLAEAAAVLPATASPAPAPRPSGSGREGALSHRELEVLRLLVAGQTDREIGAALFISPRTAQGHVAHIFEKLGVSTRTAAVAAALRAGLVGEPATSP